MEHWSENGKNKNRNQQKKKITNMLPINVEPKMSNNNNKKRLSKSEQQQPEAMVIEWIIYMFGAIVHSLR